MSRLSRATSPYLLQHADNPVDWWEWRLVLLIVGLAICAVADVVYALQVTTETYVVGTPLDALWSIGSALTRCMRTARHTVMCRRPRSRAVHLVRRPW